MGIVVKFRHESARVSTNPKTAGSASWPRSRNASTKSKYFSEGMRPRAFQFDGALADFTPAKEHAADDPPTASMTSSTDLSISPVYSRNVNMSSLHKKALENIAKTATIHRMGIDRKAVKKRIRELPLLLELDAAEICRRIKVKPNRWSQYGSPKSSRVITVDVALQLKSIFGITLDWLYDGDVASMVGHPIHRKIAQAA